MRPFGLFIGLLAVLAGGVAYASGAKTAPESPAQEDVYVRAARNYQEATDLLSDPSACSRCKPLSGSFESYEEFHFGYFLKVDDDFMHDMRPIFGPGIEDKFFEAFSADSPIAVRGKRIYCACSGWTLEHNGQTYFKINEARLYAE